MIKKVSQLVYNLFVKIKGEGWVTYHILKEDKTPTIKGLEEGIIYLKMSGKQPKKEYLEKLEIANQKWNDFLLNDKNFN